MRQKLALFVVAILLLVPLFNCFAATSASGNGDSPCTLGAVSDLRWQSRVVLVLGSPSIESDADVLRKRADAISERDVIWFALDGDAVTTNSPCSLNHAFGRSVIDRFGLDPQVILIGKDGGVKMRADTLSPDTVFDEIDSMPMRRREMARLGSSL